MRNYIILNGNNSNEIAGLLIQKLPPISQPEIRTNIEEIDGKDGDIITKLGYSAYNKEISIGLYGNYNVDDVIAYFTNNQNGQITFSNEPDKYYNYEILEQIDYEKLIRYRTATITLHCQPFKYSTTEEKIQINATEVSGSGSSINLQNTEDGALFTNLQINGDTSQDGTPTPSNPVNVDVVTGDNTIRVENKNLAEITGETHSGNVSVTQNNNEFQLTWAGGFNVYLQNIVSNLDSSKTYTVSFKHKGESLDLRNGSATVQTIRTGTNTDYTLCSAIITNITSFEFHFIRTSGTTSTAYIKDFQIELGNSSTDYIEHQEQDYTISLGTTELCKIGDYQDRIYKNNGSWYLEKNVRKLELSIADMNNSDNYPGWKNQTQLLTDIQNNTGRLGNITNYYCNIELQSNLGLAVNSSGVLYLVRSQFDNLTQTQWKTNYPNLVLTLYYGILSTPVITEITDTILLSQLEALESATTYLGETNINTSGSDLSPLLDVTTYSVDNPSFTITNSGNIYSKPIITIYGLGTVNLYLNGIQVLSLDMGSTTSQITIDVAKLEAYNQETGALMNRNVTGDYNNLSLNVGENTITESGTLQGLEVENYSRWL